MHHSSTCTYTSNFIEIAKTFCGWTDVRTDVRTDIWTLTLLGRLGGVGESTYLKMKFAKPEVHNILHSCQRELSHGHS